ncbi:MAG: MBL fold metallo-hydrolase, partial [Anaerolineae bacterium]|nr:MBL fold metallo-hydrolase [Anaerolineae bacterium]
VEDSKAINRLDGPAIIISASGMCEAGRVQHHLKHTITDPRNAVLIVSWQAPYTLGRRIVEKHPEVNIFGETYPLRARVEAINGYSAHADRQALLDWAAPIAGGLHQVLVVHGDPEASESLADGLRSLGVDKVTVPAFGDSFDILY